MIDASTKVEVNSTIFFWKATETKRLNDIWAQDWKEVQDGRLDRWADKQTH